MAEGERGLKDLELLNTVLTLIQWMQYTRQLGSETLTQIYTPIQWGDLFGPLSNNRI